MKICLPTTGTGEPQDPLHGHFGSAPCLVVYDTDTKQMHVLGNANQHHAHGACMPVHALAGEHVDAVVTGGMGQRAVTRLNDAGVRVYRLGARTVAEAIAAFEAGDVTELTPAMACGGHGHGHACH